MIRAAAVAALAWLAVPPAAAADLEFAVGKALFDRIWTTAPASTDATDGLGPLFNARSCATCHPGAGRAGFSETADGGIDGPGLVLHLGSPDGAADPAYGRQVQIFAVQGLAVEGRLQRMASGAVRLADGRFGPLAPQTGQSGRLAPDLHGLGLLERVPAEAIRAWEDPDDRDGDGISGRANLVYGADGAPKLGRFGWKAGKPSLRLQSAAAMNLDIGLSNPDYPDSYGDCVAAQAECRAAPHGASPRFANLEVDGRMLDMVTAFVAGLPPRAEPKPDAAGAAAFAAAGCAACHRPELPLAGGGRVVAYTDLLLHDMGPALADGIGDGAASGREWRTPPLWGLRHAGRFLHDGRARDLAEAIAAHDGEAAAARAAFQALPEHQRQRLLAFLSSL